jgi:hypothetical protein
MMLACFVVVLPKERSWLAGLDSLAEVGVGSADWLVMYKLNVLASARVMCNMVVCKCEVEPTRSCVLESKFNPKIILF